MPSTIWIRITPLYLQWKQKTFRLGLGKTQRMFGGNEHGGHYN